MKKIVWVSLAILLTILNYFYNSRQILPTQASGTENQLETEDGIYYQITSEQTVKITGSKASLSEIQIPSEIDGLSVTQIADYAFLDHTRLTSITIPDSVRKIGNYAFLDCSRLTTVEFPSTLQDVGWGILVDTPWLLAQQDEYVIIGNQILIAYKGTEEQITVPDGVRIIAGFTFEKNVTLQTVQLPATLRSVNDYAFAGCRNLQTIQLPESLQKIGSNAFFECKQLQQIWIPNSVKTVGERAFYQCTSLKMVHLPEGITEISAGLFCYCTALKNISLPTSVAHIGATAFQGCSALQYVALPEGIISIGNSAFAECTNLQEIFLNSATCEIYASETVFPEQAILVSVTSSALQRYATTYNRSFVALPLTFGDVDENGVVDVSDAVMILIAYARNCANAATCLTDRQKIAADYNQDGCMDVTDAVAVLTYYAKKAAGQEVD